MAGSTIEAKLRIALLVSEAIAGLKAFRAELKGAKNDAAGIAGAAGAGAAARSDTDQVVQQVRRRGQAEREALAETKRLAREKVNAERAAAAEARRARQEEDKLRRAEDTKRQRDQRTAADAESKAKSQQAYKAAQLAPQLTDITVGLATGQNPITIALQQGGQLRDIYGSAGGALRALLSVLTPVRVAVGAAAAGFATLAVNIASGYRESSQLRKDLALTGNAAGTSLGQINDLANSIAAEQRTSVAFVREVLGGLITTSGQTEKTLGATGRAAAALAKLTGQSAQDTLKGFDDQAAGITDWAVKSNKAYNFLTAEQVRYIRSMEQQGRVAEAIKFTNEQLATSLTQRGQPAIGAIEKAWNAAGRALGNFLDQLKGLGRDETAEDKLKRLKQQLAEIDARLAQPSSAGRRKSTDRADRSLVAGQIEQIKLEAAERAKEANRLQAEKDRIFRESKEFQDIIAQQGQANAQQALATKLAGLDAERDAVERAYAQEIESAVSRNLKLNRIDRDRAIAQEAFAEAELATERKRQGALKSVSEVEAGKATITSMEARLIEARGRTAAAVAEGSRLIDAEIARLNEDIQARMADNARDDIPKLVADPLERAKQTAIAETDNLRRELRDLQRDLTAARSAAGEGGSALVDRLQRQVNEASQKLTNETRRSELQSLLTQSEETLQAIGLAEQRLDLLVEQGAITTAEAEDKKLKVRQQNLEVLRQIETQVKKLAQTPDEKNSAGQLAQKVKEAEDARLQVEKTIRGSLQSGFADLFKDIATGASSGLEAIRKFARGVASAMLDLIARRLGEQLVNSLLGPASGTPGSGGGLFPFLQSIFASVNHQGGVIGAAGGLARAVSPLVFAGAQILHNGGLVGLRSNEVPVIAEQGEEMLTEDNPRHIKNFRGGPVIGSLSVQVNVTSSSEPGGEARLGQGLAEGIKSVIHSYMADQMRQGGLLARR